MSLAITPMPLSQIARWAQGRLDAAPDSDPLIDAVETDTRAFGAGASTLFVALRGERFDGNDHVAAAAACGARAALVSRPSDAGIAQIVVDDTQTALAMWAGAVQHDRGQAHVLQERQRRRQVVELVAQHRAADLDHRETGCLKLRIALEVLTDLLGAGHA